jgi:hypothetical protein
VTREAHVSALQVFLLLIDSRRAGRGCAAARHPRALAPPHPTYPDYRM